MFLDAHTEGYNISLKELALSSFSISGIVYSKRHWELSMTCNSRTCWGHRTIAILEAIPLMGGLVALIERIAIFIKEKYFNNKVTNAVNYGSLKNQVEPLKKTNSL